MSDTTIVMLVGILLYHFNDDNKVVNKCETRETILPDITKHWTF